MSKSDKLKEAFDALDECEKLITDRIMENNTVGAQAFTKQATHAFVLYRKLVWEAKYIIRDIMESK